MGKCKCALKIMNRRSLRLYGFLFGAPAVSQLGVFTAVKTRLAERSDSEHGQAIVRLVIVAIILAYFCSDFFLDYVGDGARARQARWLATLSFVASMAIFARIVMRPSASVIRRLVGMFHDVVAISASIYLGEAAGAAVAVAYLWITIGNGFRFGIRYLYGCAAFSSAGFLAVYATSGYWQSNTTLTVNILLTLAVVPAYVGSLLKSLHEAKDQLQHQASTDSLTGLLSRAEIESSAESLLSGDSSNHVLLFCDLDRFKEVNDIAGHAAGDKLLTDIATIIRSCIRNDDLAGRIGGDEFCVLLRRCPLEAGRKVAETIRSRTAGYRLAWGTEYFSVGVSIGVAPSDAVGDAESLFRLADAACYAAKNAGRNKVHIVDPQMDHIDTQVIRKLFDDGSVISADSAG